MAQDKDWCNRIVGSGVKRASEFHAHPKNWRVHPQPQRDALCGSLNEVGWVAPVVENVRTGNLLDGHERVEQALAHGDGEVPYVQLDLDPEEESYVLATLDPIGVMAEANEPTLSSLLSEVKSHEAGVLDLLSHVKEMYGIESEAVGPNYSRRIEPPVYEPSGDKPRVSDLYDEQRTRSLLEAIEANESITEEERAFLRAAAQRHTVFRFDRIAEYYAHASPGLQRLMEDSALVIVDFERAIELGFVRMTQAIADQVRDEYGE